MSIVIFVVFEKVPSTTRPARQFFSPTAQRQVASIPSEPPAEEPWLRSVNSTIYLIWNICMVVCHNVSMCENQKRCYSQWFQAFAWVSRPTRTSVVAVIADRTAFSRKIGQKHITAWFLFLMLFIGIAAWHMWVGLAATADPKFVCSGNGWPLTALRRLLLMRVMSSHPVHPPVNTRRSSVFCGCRTHLEHSSSLR